MNQNQYHMFKAAVYRLMDFCGLNAYCRFRNRDKLRVFALHGVGDHKAKHDWMPLRVQTDVTEFDLIVKKLCKQYHFISIGDAVRMLTHETPIVKNAAVMTFDDGYWNNFTQALPILRKYKIPGVFFIATGVVRNRKPFWFDRLDYVLQTAAIQGVEFSLAGKRFRFNSTERLSISESYAELRRYCKINYPDDSEFVRALGDLASDLEQKTGVSLESVLENDGWARVVSEKEIAYYGVDELVTYGGHTVTHLRLDCASEEHVAKELLDSKVSIENWSGLPCLDFAYPNGNYDKSSIQSVRTAGYRSAVTSDYGFNSVGDNVYTIKRLDIPVDFSMPEILARASGLEEALVGRLSSLKQKVRQLVSKN